MPAFDVPVVKATNCVLVSSPSLFPPALPEMNCIRCGECAKACPADLRPFELYWFSRARNFGKAQEYHLFDCIEMRLPLYVCPRTSAGRLLPLRQERDLARERDKGRRRCPRALRFSQPPPEREKQETARLSREGCGKPVPVGER